MKKLLLAAITSFLPSIAHAAIYELKFVATGGTGRANGDHIVLDLPSFYNLDLSIEYSGPYDDECECQYLALPVIELPTGNSILSNASARLNIKTDSHGYITSLLYLWGDDFTDLIYKTRGWQYVYYDYGAPIVLEESTGYWSVNGIPAVPLPATAPLLGAALGLFALRRHIR